MTVLSVNLNKVALLRNQRDLPYPSVTGFAEIILAAGAAGITVHPRPDERHIRRQDVYDLVEFLKGWRAQPGRGHAEFNIEGYPTEDFLNLVAQAQPDQVTLVPDAPDQKTSDHGWQIDQSAEFLSPIIARLKAQGARVSLFLDPDPALAVLAGRIGADRIELYTEPYYQAHAAGRAEETLALYERTAKAASDCGLGLNAGHDLNLDNLGEFVSRVPETLEVSIGHAITADALRFGMAKAVEAYLEVIAQARGVTLVSESARKQLCR
jgi:pyridoxine 5-phosphate synthase